jgi:hypothetical protein
MKRAITIVWCIGGLGFMSGLLTYRMGWSSAKVAGVYICIVAAVVLLIAALLSAVEWIRKNVRIQ